VVRFTPATAEGAAQLKRFLRAQVYESEQLVHDRQRSVERIAQLFELLVTQPELMPAAYLEESAGEPLQRQVCDYIAGMTDGFFARTCDQLGI
jgi:dGTPase